MIRKATLQDFEAICRVINDAAIAYKGIIPADRWQEPYMSKEELTRQLEEGVHFFCFMMNDEVAGVMGIQEKSDVNLIRHAYVSTLHRNKGIGTALLNILIQHSKKPVLIGTWKAATWAISFYEKHGFYLLSDDEKTSLLKKYWIIPERQVETSVVLADKNYRDKNMFY